MSLLQEISIGTGLSITDVLRIIETAPLRYKKFFIPKRNGGVRQIAQPSRELKLLQRFLIETRLSALPVHSAAMAYVRDRNIHENALQHRQGNVLLKLDFSSFFPSILVSDWNSYIRRNKPEWIANKDQALLQRILFWGEGSPKPKCLSIGAPTSPLVSNLLMFDLDTAFSAEAESLQLSYTRYADDITVSGASLDAVLKFEKFVRSTIKKTKSPKLKINEEKRGLYTRGQRRLVTGLVITPQNRVSIGRERKREISSLIHRFSLDQLDIEKIGHLKGMLGFTIANEPEFLSRMRRKYGNAVIDAILKTNIPRKGQT